MVFYPNNRKMTNSIKSSSSLYLAHRCPPFPSISAESFLPKQAPPMSVSFIMTSCVSEGLLHQHDVCVWGGLWYTGTGQLDNDYTHHWRNVSHLPQKPSLSRNGWGRRAGPSTIDCWQAWFAADLTEILRHEGREEWGQAPSCQCTCLVSLPPCSVPCASH